MQRALHWICQQVGIAARGSLMLRHRRPPPRIAAWIVATVASLHTVANTCNDPGSSETLWLTIARTAPRQQQPSSARRQAHPARESSTHADQINEMRQRSTPSQHSPPGHNLLVHAARAQRRRAAPMLLASQRAPAALSRSRGLSAVLRRRAAAAAAAAAGAGSSCVQEVGGHEQLQRDLRLDLELGDVARRPAAAAAAGARQGRGRRGVWQLLRGALGRAARGGEGLGGPDSRVLVAQLVVEVLADLLEDGRRDLGELDLAQLGLREGTCASRGRVALSARRARAAWRRGGGLPGVHPRS
jgi:hypothetical protein